MTAPSKQCKQRIVEMFDSFCKTVSRNCSRNLCRAKENHSSHFTQEPIDLFLELWGIEDEYPFIPFTIHVYGYPCFIESEKLYNALLSLPERQRTVILLDFWQELTDKEIAKRWRLPPVQYIICVSGHFWRLNNIMNTTDTTPKLTYELIQKAVKGDTTALEEILRYYEPYHNTLSTYETVDAIQHKWRQLI